MLALFCSLIVQKPLNTSLVRFGFRIRRDSKPGKLVIPRGGRYVGARQFFSKVLAQSRENRRREKNGWEPF